MCVLFNKKGYFYEVLLLYCESGNPSCHRRPNYRPRSIFGEVNTIEGSNCLVKAHKIFEILTKSRRSYGGVAQMESVYILDE